MKPVLMSLLAAAVLAQTPTDLKFEVASIRPSAEQNHNTSIYTGAGGIRTSNTSLHMLITTAYNARSFQILDANGWIQDQRFDINAKIDDDADAGFSQKARMERLQVRLRNLLADRFQLKIREETRELPIYALVIDKGSQHKMKISTSGNGSTNTNESNGSGSFRGDGIKMSSLALHLSGTVGRTVLNQTGLADEIFAVDLKWSDGSTGEGPSVFTAVREQLGLRLESKKGPVAVFVVERAAKPSEN